MGFLFTSIVHAKLLIQKPFTSTKDIPKGFLAFYVGDESRMKRFVIPVAYLNQPSFQDFLSRAEEEYDSIIQWGLSQFPGLPWSQDAFIDIVSCLNAL